MFKTHVKSCVVFAILISFYSCKSKNTEHSLKATDNFNKDSKNSIGQLKWEYYITRPDTIETFVTSPRLNNGHNGNTISRTTTYAQLFIYVSADSNYVFLNPVKFTNCDFSSRNEIDNETIHWNSCKFNSVAIFENIGLLKDFNLDNSYFNDTCIYYSGFTSRKTTINGKLVGEIYPGKKIIFSNCTFKRGIFFNNSLIKHQEADLYGSYFKNDVIFENCELNGKADFSKTNFDSTSSLIFFDTFLPDTLDLSDCKVGGYINLLNTYPKKKDFRSQLNIMGTDVTKVKLQYKNFHLFIPDSVLDDPNKIDVVSNIYELLLNNFERDGFQDSYRSLDIEYKKWQSKRDWTLIISNYWWNFGYSKWRILIFTTGFLLLFSLFNYKAFHNLQLVYPIEKLVNYKPGFAYNKRSLLVKKYFVALVYTGYIFFKFGIDFKNFNFKPLRYVAVILFEYTIGLLCTGFLINWILKG